MCHSVRGLSEQEEEEDKKRTSNKWESERARNRSRMKSANTAKSHFVLSRQWNVWHIHIHELSAVLISIRRQKKIHQTQSSILPQDMKHRNIQMCES